MQDIRISVITPTMNSREFIAQTMCSVLDQGYQNMEHIIVDAQSTDGTLDIVRDMEPAYGGRLRLISEPDDGIYDAMNKGIRMATGDVIGIINSDDYYMPGAFGEVARAFQDERVGIVYSDTRLMYRDDTLKKTLACNARGDGKPVPIVHQSCFIRKRVHDLCGLYDANLKIAADLDLFVRAERAGVVFRKVDMPLAAFRLGGISDNIAICLKDRYQIERKYHGALYSSARLMPWAVHQYAAFCVKKLIGYDRILKKRHAGTQQ